MQTQPSQYCSFLCGSTTGTNKTECENICAAMENTPISQAMIYYPFAETSEYFSNFFTVSKDNLNRLANEILITNIIYIYYPILTIVFFFVVLGYFLGYISLLLTMMILFIVFMILVMYGVIYSGKLRNFVELHTDNIIDSFNKEILNNSDFKNTFFLELAEQWNNSEAKPT